jgi:branched-subunit amino acid aminotransferase/4-amino-4-deoxychorismate lyase
LASSVLINGGVADSAVAEATLAGASERLGEAWFETLRITAGIPELLHAHLDRLSANIDFDRASVTTELARAIDLAGGGDLHARIVVGPSGRIVSTAQLPEQASGGKRYKLTVVDVPEYAFPAKLASYEPQTTLLIEARDSGFDDVLITDASLVIEAATANVLLIEDETLRTPPLGRCLPGVTRAALIEGAPQAGLTVVEEPVRINHLLAADEVLLTNSLIRLRRAGEVDGVPVGGRARDRVLQLEAALLDRIAST